MFIDQIEKIRNFRLSEPLQNWFSTLLFLPLAIYFRFIIGTWLILDKDFSAFSRTLWILGSVFSLWLIWKWLFDDHLIITGLEGYLGGFFLVACLSTAFSANASLSVEKLIGIGSYLFSIYLLLDLRRSPNLWQGLINSLLITAGISSLLILITAIPWIKLYPVTLTQIISSPAYLLKVIPRLPYSLGFHQSVTAGYLVMILPLSLYQLIKSKKTSWRIIQAAGLALNILILLLTQSRGGLLGLVFLVFVTILVFREEIWGFITKKKTISIVAISTLALGGFAFIYLIGKSRGFNIVGRTIQMRFDQWRIALLIIQESPWLGSGLGTYGQRYLELRDAAFYPGTFIHAHNQLLQITTELGFLGLIALLLIIWQGFRLLGKGQDKLPASSKVSIIALGGLFGVLIPDAILTSSMIVLLLLFYLVWLLPTGLHLPTLDKSIGLSLLSGAAILLVCCGVWILWKLQPYDNAVQSAKQDDWPAANTALLSAVERDPTNPYYLHTLAYAEGQIACQNGENANKAVDYYQQSFTTYQNWGISHANAAVLYAINGDYQNAAEQMDWAVQNFPQNSTYYCLLGDYYSQLNNLEAAVDSYVKCIGISPHFLDSPFWQEDKNKRELIPTVFATVESGLLNQADGESITKLAALYLAVDDLEKAHRIIQDYLTQFPNDLNGNVIYLKILESRGDLSTAEDKIDRLLNSYPRNSDLWIFKGKLAQQDGNEKIAESALELGYRLKPSAEKSWILGQFYQSQGDIQEAMELYMTSLNSVPAPSLEFSRPIAGRWPIGNEYFDCMTVIRTYRDYFDPALRSAQDLERQDCNLAACIYQELLDNNPGIKDFQTRLESLPCAKEADSDYCIDRETE